VASEHSMLVRAGGNRRAWEPSSEADLARGGVWPSSEADLARGCASLCHLGGPRGPPWCQLCCARVLGSRLVYVLRFFAGFKRDSPGCLGDPYGCPRHPEHIQKVFLNHVQEFKIIGTRIEDEPAPIEPSHYLSMTHTPIEPSHYLSMTHTITYDFIYFLTSRRVSLVGCFVSLRPFDKLSIIGYV
jgi:hypothetical protein